MNDNLTIGQSLTPEQVRDLPDGAVWKMKWASYCEWRLFTAPLSESAAHDQQMGSWSSWGWHSATLVSLPATELQNIKHKTCQNCGTKFSVGEFHGCVNPKNNQKPDAVTEPSPGDGYTYGGTGAPAKASPPPELPRVASDSPMAQKAAITLLDCTMADMRETALPNGIEPTYNEVAALCHDYLRAHDYARSIGAIE